MEHIDLRELTENGIPQINKDGKSNGNGSKRKYDGNNGGESTNI